MQYQYTKDSFNKSQLEDEIRASQITIALDGIQAEDNLLTIVFKLILSDAEKLILDGLVSSHIKQVNYGEVVTPLTSNNIPKVAVYDSEGVGESIASHDFSNKSTWYQGSIRVVDELITIVNNKYSFQNIDIIDCKHGHITFEDELLDAYGLFVYDNGVLLIEDKDYQCDHSKGKIYFNEGYTPLGQIKASYSYATNSHFDINIPEGEVSLKIRDSEIQFTSDITMKPMVFEIMITHPEFGLMPIFSKTYKNIKDLINIARGGKGSIPRIDGFKHEVIVLPVKYAKTIILTQGAFLRVKTINDEIIDGEYATITFYTEVDK